MKRFALILTVLALPALGTQALELTGGLQLGFTPYSLSQNLAFQQLNTYKDDTNTLAAGEDFQLGSSPRNLAIGLIAEAALGEKFWASLGFNYALGLGGGYTAVNGTTTDAMVSKLSYLSIPLYFGVKQGPLKIGLGLEFLSVTYTDKRTRTVAGVQNDGQSWDHSFSGSQLAFSLLLGTDVPLSESMILGVNLVYQAAPMALKRDGKDRLDDTVNTIEYAAMDIAGWMLVANLRFKL